VHLLDRLEPGASAHRLHDHCLRSRLTEAIEIDDVSALPAELLTTQTKRTPNKSSIKARIRAVIAAAVAGLPKPEATHLAFPLAATAVQLLQLLQARRAKQRQDSAPADGSRAGCASAPGTQKRLGSDLHRPGADCGDRR
jgi:hypothetical protein